MSCVGRLVVVVAWLQNWTPEASSCLMKVSDDAIDLDITLLQTSVALRETVAAGPAGLLMQDFRFNHDAHMPAGVNRSDTMTKKGYALGPDALGPFPNMQGPVSVAQLSSSVQTGDGNKKADNMEGGIGFQLVPFAVLCFGVGSIFIFTITGLRKGFCSCMFLVAFLGSTMLSTALGIYFLHVRSPVWEMTDISIENLKLPLLYVDGIYPVKSDACPPEDPCGLAAAKGCARCVFEEDFNRGCYCQRNHNKLPAPPGTVISADTSSCPAIDKCGLTVAKGCSKCPSDDGWANDGCTCRMSGGTEDFLKRTYSIAGVASGAESALSFTLRSDIVSENRNYVSALMLESPLVVSYKGENLGRALVEQSMVKARSKKHTPVSVTVDRVDTEMSRRISQNIALHAGLMTVDVIGNITSVVTLFMYKIQIQTLTNCSVTANVFEDSKVVGKQCTYSHSW